MDVDATNYFEDFSSGMKFEHQRGRTVTNWDNLWISQLSLNTAQPHYNLEYARQLMGGAFPERLVMGGVTLALVIGLTSEDMSENAFVDLGLRGIRLPNPVFKDDTLYATSEVVDVCDSETRDDAGCVRYSFTGYKSDGSIVIEGERELLIKRRSHWATVDDRFGK